MASCSGIAGPLFLGFVEFARNLLSYPKYFFLCHMFEYQFEFEFELEFLLKLLIPDFKPFCTAL